MADYAPPSGPPPPKVPEGWKAVWNNEYNEWFYVNLHTKTSQWDLPSAPAYPSSPSGLPPSGAPPSYAGGGLPHHDEKGAYQNNNPYNTAPQGSNIDADAAYAARLQAEEDERARHGTPHDSRGAADGYYQNPQGQGPQPGGLQGGYPGAPGSYDQHELPPREQKSKGLGGLLSKLSGKASGGAGGSSHMGGGGYPQQHGGYGGYPQQGYGGGYGPQQQYGGYPPQHGKKPGMGMAGAGALGLGGGLVGGALLGSALGGDDSGYGGGDSGYGGGDDGGGDYGGDSGGGDFGGGDGGGGD
ncbi:MAG: hypothetical protein LQ346_006646 [Caloplaca aetnensis]|nr:MAG: hypothetical protein LQ346_006646 [Caloplaca aetnensis]